MELLKLIFLFGAVAITAGCSGGFKVINGFQQSHASSAPLTQFGVIQHPTLFNDNGEKTRPPWQVAGVDYPTGIPAGTVLRDPTTATLPSGVTLDLPNKLMHITGNGVTLDGYDFSLHGGFGIDLIGATGTRIVNSYFLGGVPVSGDLNSSNTYIGFNTIDGGGVSGNLSAGELIDVQGSVTVEYNWIKNAPQHFLSLGGGGTIAYQFNVLEEGGWYVGAQLNYLEFKDGTFTNPQVLYNTVIQHVTLASGEVFQLYTSAAGSISGAEVAYNTVITVPNGGATTAATFVLQAGSGTQFPSPSAGTVHDNYLDASSSSGAFYVGLSGFTYAGNLDLKTGLVIPGP